MEDQRLQVALGLVHQRGSQPARLELKGLVRPAGSRLAKAGRAQEVLCAGVGAFEACERGPSRIQCIDSFIDSLIH